MTEWIWNISKASSNSDMFLVVLFVGVQLCQGGSTPDVLPSCSLFCASVSLILSELVWKISPQIHIHIVLMLFLQGYLCKCEYWLWISIGDRKSGGGLQRIYNPSAWEIETGEPRGKLARQTSQISQLCVEQENVWLRKML